MTSNSTIDNTNECPAEGLLKKMSGKWKPQIFKLALSGDVRFSELLRQLPGANKQSLSIALRELEESGLLDKTIITHKPLHISYSLSASGRAVIPLFQQLEEVMVSRP